MHLHSQVASALLNRILNIANQVHLPCCQLVVHTSVVTTALRVHGVASRGLSVARKLALSSFRLRVVGGIQYSYWTCQVKLSRVQKWA